MFNPSMYHSDSPGSDGKQRKIDFVLNRKIFVKLYDPDGNLRTGNSSPSGYSYSETLYIGSGRGQQRVMGWGNKEKGYWKAGNYRIEFWYNNSCIFTKTFTIY